MTRRAASVPLFPSFRGGERVVVGHKRWKQRQTSESSRHQHAAASSLFRQLRRQTTTTTTTRPQESTLLLLEGDEFYVSQDGLSRTYYELSSSNNNDRSSASSVVSLEECYDLKRARKTFLIRKRQSFPPFLRFGTHSQDMVEMGAPWFRRNDTTDIMMSPLVELQEIRQHQAGEFMSLSSSSSSAGTGATTWESSIAMSLFFSSHPNLLRGNVLELGSGVGLTGLLAAQLHVTTTTTNVAVASPLWSDQMQSLTLTDGNDQVLQQCRQNLRHMQACHLPIRVEKLDWNDYVVDKSNGAAGTKPSSESSLSSSSVTARQYDTVLASDCAYQYPDILALATTMTTLLQRNDDARIHIFGPYNRGALEELIHQLKNGFDMDVALDWIEMSRYRLKPAQYPHRGNIAIATSTSSGFPQIDSNQYKCPFASRKTAKFLHITASHRTLPTSTARRGLSDID